MLAFLCKNLDYKPQAINLCLLLDLIVLIFEHFIGDKSEVIDIDTPDLTEFPLFDNVTRYEGLLEEGDVLFIPGMYKV